MQGQFFADYLERLEDLQRRLHHEVEDLPVEAMDWSPGVKMNSVAVLLAHIGGLLREGIDSMLAGDLGEGHDVRDPNLGGTVLFDWGWARWVPAWHTSTTPKGTINTPAGIVLNIGGRTIYHLGDTALFSDLQLVSRQTPVDVALVCIGGHYTMDRHDAVEAVKLIGADVVIPIHYDTFPPIETDAQAFKADVEGATSSQVVVLDPGETHSA